MKPILCIFMVLAAGLTLLQSEEDSPNLKWMAASIIDPDGFRVVRIDGKEQGRINDRFTIFIPPKEGTSKIEMVVKAQKNKNPEVVSFSARIEPAREYRILAITDYFILQEEPKK